MLFKKVGRDYYNSEFKITLDVIDYLRLNLVKYAGMPVNLINSESYCIFNIDDDNLFHIGNGLVYSAVAQNDVITQADIDYALPRLSNMLPYGTLSVDYDSSSSNEVFINVSYSLSEIELSLYEVFYCENIMFGMSGFDTNLYPELLDNTETESMLKTYINDGDISGYTDKDLEIMRLIEKYNKNVLALRATKKVEIENTINTSSDSPATVDLSTVNQQLTNINNALHYTNTDDVVKNLTEVVAENDKSVLVENNVVESAPYNPHLKKYDLFEG